MFFWKKEEPIQAPQAPQEEPLPAFTPNIPALSLKKILEYADTIVVYLKLLIKQLTDFNAAKDESKRQRLAESISITTKYLNLNGLELKTLLGHLERHYYEPLLNSLNQTLSRTPRPEHQQHLTQTQDHLNTVKELDTLLTRLIGYNALLNKERNPTFAKDIQNEVEKQELDKELQALAAKITIALLDKKTSILKAITPEPLKF